MKVGVLGLVDHTHSAASEILNDAVVQDGLADHGGLTSLLARGASIPQTSSA
jgi:hypothetical protein